MTVPTVSQLTRKIQYNLNRDFGSVWVQGEISGLTQPASGHAYLTLKDPRAQLNAILWKSNVEQLKFELKNGLAVECGGYIDVYPQRGTYQLIIRSIRPEGLGALELARKQLENKLRAEGLFDPIHKQAVPRFPRHVAVVTSPTGAAVRDFLQVLTRRWPKIRVTVVPVTVQGEQSSREIAMGINLCNHFAERPDVIVVTRGGGSQEDLWSFNEEIVVRSIFASQVPVVSAVGHESDVLLSDLVADVRALTPSEAAEKLTPDFTEVIGWLNRCQGRLANSLMGSLAAARQELASLASRRVIARPFESIRRSAQELDGLEQRLRRSQERVCDVAGHQLAELIARLESMNPLAVLARGYSVTVDEKGKIVESVNQVKAGDELVTRLAKGSIRSTVVGSEG